MVVKAATKKYLMDNGIPEWVAHRLADDRTIKQLWEKTVGVHILRRFTDYILEVLRILKKV